nr:hypothetical protein [Microbacterium profundi]
MFSNALPLTTKLAESLADALARKRSVGSEVEQVVFLRPKNDESVFELGAAQMLSVGFVTHGALKIVAHDVYELGAEFDLFVMLLDCGFDIVDVGEWCVTRAVLGTSAEEVPVLAATFANGALLDQPPVGVALKAAVPAPDAALEIMGVAAATLSRHTSCFEDPLHSVEHPLVDERSVASLEDFVFICDLSDVVAITKHLLDLGIRDWPSRPSEFVKASEAGGC